MELNSKAETKRTFSPLTLPIESGLRGEGEAAVTFMASMREIPLRGALTRSGFDDLLALYILVLLNSTLLPVGIPALRHLRRAARRARQSESSVKKRTAIA